MTTGIVHFEPIGSVFLNRVKWNSLCLELDECTAELCTK